MRKIAKLVLIISLSITVGCSTQTVRFEEQKGFRAIAFIDSFDHEPIDKKPVEYRQELHRCMAINRANRIAVRSQWFYVNDKDVDLMATYNGWDLHKNERVRQADISKKALKMIEGADKFIVASVFLFDCMYSKNSIKHDVVTELVNLVIKKRKKNPDLKVVLVLDPVNRAYANRISPAVQLLVDNGVDVFYSDLLTTKSAIKPKYMEGSRHLFRVMNEMTLGASGSIWDFFTSVPIPAGELDGQKYSIEMAQEAALLKANHRKLLIVDSYQGKDFEALVPSANPHNASDDSTNYALSIKGDAAKFIYSVVREDVAHSMLQFQSRPLEFRKHSFAHFSEQSKKKYKIKRFGEKWMIRYLNEHLPPINPEEFSGVDLSKKVKASFVTEVEIKKVVLEMLSNAAPDDDVRIQMFYLSEPDIVETISKAASHTERKASNPIRIIMDPSKDAFNSIKDGTPNRQVAHYLLNELQTPNLNIRWYSTHGEQNHAKIMSITNELKNKYEIITGSCNWTGKNMNNINMESNLAVIGSKRITDKFNTLFDCKWDNKEKGIEYTWDYDKYDLFVTHKMVIGKEIYDKMDESEKEKWLSKNLERVRVKLINSNDKYLNGKSPVYVRNWVERALKKDKGSVIRNILILLGEDEIARTGASFDKWRDKYVKKWRNGEEYGLVSW